MMLLLAFVVFLVLFTVFMADLSSKEKIFMLSVDIKYGDIASIVIVFLYQLLRNYV